MIEVLQAPCPSGFDSMLKIVLLAELCFLLLLNLKRNLLFPNSFTGLTGLAQSGA
jgi:hypothetical protein